MEEPVLSRVLLCERLTSVRPACRWGRATGGVDAVDLLNITHGVCLRDGGLGCWRIGGAADGGELEPWHGLAAILAVVSVGRGSGAVDLFGKANAVVFVDCCLADSQIGVKVEGGGGVAVGEIVMAGLEGLQRIHAGLGLVRGIDKLVEKRREGLCATWLHQTCHVVQSRDSTKGKWGGICIESCAGIVLGVRISHEHTVSIYRCIWTSIPECLGRQLRDRVRDPVILEEERPGQSGCR